MTSTDISVQGQVEKHLTLAQSNPSLCIAPYNILDVRHSDFLPNIIYKTCCCNLDARTFVASTGLDPFAEIKAQQLAGEWPTACHRCRSEEHHGGQSERVVGFMMYPTQRLQKFIDTTVVNDYEVRVKFSNLCNLACRSCSPTESSSYARITNTTVDTQYEVDISESPEHWEFITASILEKKDLYEHFYVHFIGGESLIQPGMKKLIDWMIDQGIAPDINLRLTTALTVNPNQDLLSKMSQFKTIDINLSIDSVDRNYQYIRWPARFEKIEINLDTLVDFDKKLTVQRGRKVWMPRWNCVLTPVFSLNNIFYIKDWIDYWNNWFARKGFVFLMFSINLTEPTWHLDVEALPLEYRPVLAGILTECLTHELFVRYPNETKALYNFLTSTIDELATMPENLEQWQKYLSHTAYFDKKTNQSFAILNERLYNILSMNDRSTFQYIFDRINTDNNFVKEVTFYKKLD